MPRIKEQLSVLGFGTMRLPLSGDGQIDEPAAERMIRSAIDNGVNYIDTARPYHGGKSEPFTGKALKGLRDKVLLATKLPCWLVKTRREMDTHLEEQLTQLQTDHIDVYLLHSLKSMTWTHMLELGALDFLQKARDAGKIRYIAFSFHDGIDLFKSIVDAFPWDACQIQFNMLDESYQAGREGMLYAAERDIGVIAMEPLRGGNLTPPLPKELEPMARAIGYTAPTLADIALRWVWNHPEISVVLSGMTAPEHVTRNIESASRALPNSLTQQELDFVQAVRNFFVSRMRVPCTYCAYCKPCPHGVDIPQCFANYNTASMADAWDVQKASYHYLLDPSRGAKKASACVECNACLPKCPQHIPIPEKLKEVVEVFGA
jgi:predicted aldo/keto reductase-like oxidoreductase